MIDKVKLKSLCDVKTCFVHKVEKGETVFSLARRFHTTVEVIVKINGLIEDVRQGQFVLIEKIDGKEYFVKPEDTIFKIADNDNEKSTRILAKNRVDFLYVGQKLYI